jgi:hypothetical protein
MAIVWAQNLRWVEQGKLPSVFTTQVREGYRCHTFNRVYEVLVLRTVIVGVTFEE